MSGENYRLVKIGAAYLQAQILHRFDQNGGGGGVIS